jgi:hypothetical protein
MATLLKVLDNLADIKSAGGVALGLGTQAPSLRNARGAIETFLRTQAYELDFVEGEDPINALINTSVSSSARELLDYYGTIAVCIRSEICDRDAICESVVPQITSLQLSVIRAAHRKSDNIGNPSKDKTAWTEADRVLNACQM